MLEEDAWAQRRREAARRLPPLCCGCRDPLKHECEDLPSTVVDGIPLDWWRAARNHLAREGYRAIMPDRVRQLLGETEVA